MVVLKKISVIALIVFAAVLLSSAPVLAEDENAAIDDRPYKFMQGFVSEESAGGFTLNEQWRVFVFPNTRVLSSSETELARESLKGHKWVYVEGPVNSYGNIEAEFIYLLPRVIDRDERREYPFIKTP